MATVQDHCGAAGNWWGEGKPGKGSGHLDSILSHLHFTVCIISHFYSHPFTRTTSVTMIKLNCVHRIVIFPLLALFIGKHAFLLVIVLDYMMIIRGRSFLCGLYRGQQVEPTPLVVFSPFEISDISVCYEKVLDTSFERMAACVVANLSWSSRIKIKIWRDEVTCIWKLYSPVFKRAGGDQPKTIWYHSIFTICVCVQIYNIEIYNIEI